MSQKCESEWVILTGNSGGDRSDPSLSEEQANTRLLVLQAKGIPASADRCEAGWVIMVPFGYADRALRELRLFEDENRDWPSVLPVQESRAGNTLSTLSVLILLATFHNLTLLGTLFGCSRPEWIAAGSADAGRIASGEWWRSITALTLHADWVHLAANLAIGAVFIIYLCRDLGSGLAWTAMVSAGAIGNMLNALVQPFFHSSVGASTLVFASVGILASLRLVSDRGRIKPAVPVAASLALLALLGSEGERTDLGSHLFGFVAGGGIGFIIGHLVKRFGRPRKGLDLFLAFFCACVVVGAWSFALSA